MKKLILILLVGSLLSISCGNDDGDNNMPKQNSIVGTWKVTSLTENGTEILQEILTQWSICYWTDVYEETTFSSIFFSGTNCTTEILENQATYTINETNASITIDGDVYEILELTNTTLKLRESYEDEGENIVDVYTYEKVE